MENPSINAGNINLETNSNSYKKESKIWKCEKCGIVFTFKSRYEEHKNRKTSCVKEEKQEYKLYEKKEILCKECGKTFSRKCNLEAHKQKCKGKHTLQCERCYKFFSCIQSRFTHEKNGKCVPIEKPPIQYTKDNTKDNIKDNTKIKELQDEIQNLKNENDKLKHLNKNTYSSVVPQEYIYLLCEYHNKNANENIYKVGKTKEIYQRMSKYPKGCALIYLVPCENMDSIERYIITEFKKEFIHRPDRGSEYFQGDVFKIIIKIENVIRIQRNSQN